MVCQCKPWLIAQPCAASTIPAISIPTHIMWIPLPFEKTLSCEGWRAQFVEVAKFIRDNGFPRKFYRATFWYYAYEGKIYWTMDKVIEETDLVNRADEANKY